MSGNPFSRYFSKLLPSIENIGSNTVHAVESPITAFQKWLSTGNPNGPDANPSDPTQPAFDQARKNITQATDQSKALLNPYVQGGLQDYNNYRAKVNSGYYNTPMPGGYTPPAPPQAQAYHPTWNPQTQSFESNRIPYQSQQQAPQAMHALPQWNGTLAQQQSQQPGYGQPGGSDIQQWLARQAQPGGMGQQNQQGGQMDPNAFIALLQKIKQGQMGNQGQMGGIA